MDPETHTESVDCISLETYPQKYQVKLGTTYHDARSVAEYMISGGQLHPLTRKPFKPEDYNAIKAKVPSDLLQRLENFISGTKADVMNGHIIDVLGIIRAVNFLNILSADQASAKEALSSFFGCLRGTSSILAFLASDIASEIIVDALMKSLPDVSEDVMDVLESKDLERKRVFFDTLNIPAFDVDYYQSFISTTDLFSLVKVMTMYTLDTEFKL